MEIPSLVFRIAWLSPLTRDSMSFPIAKPAASSTEELIRLPEDKRSKAVSSAELELINDRCAAMDATLVLIERGILHS